MNIGIEDLVGIRRIIGEYTKVYAKYQDIIEEIHTVMGRVSDLEHAKEEISKELNDIRLTEHALLDKIRSAPDFDQAEFQKILFES